MRRRRLAAVAAGGAAVCGTAAALLAAGYLTLRASLPPLDGRIAAAGLAAPAAIERDALGVPTITAANRADLAFATGFVHGQDRFFQMDLARRLAAGELSELVGRAALAQDLETRVFRFREVARSALAEATPPQRALLESYARGVNAGLASLRSRPWEYWLLRARPAPWLPEDSFLTGFAMWWQLQSDDFARERLKRQIDARLGGPVCAGGWKCALEFLYPSRTIWDAPLVVDEAALRAEEARDDTPPAVPGPEVLDIRGAGEPARGAGVSAGGAAGPAGMAARSAGDIGSNGWAVSGRLTSSGAALVASDMHLPLGVPPIWYRVRLRIARERPDRKTPSAVGGARGGDARADSAPLDLDGLTLPGTPSLIAGSNGQVAWAFTNSGGKWLDEHAQPCLAVDDRWLRTPDGDMPLSTVIERIHVRGGADVLLPVRSLAAAPPIGHAPSLLLEVDLAAHRCWVGTWLAETPSATNFNLLALERAASVQDVLALAPQIGIPEQNIVVGDRAGHIGWAIAGRIPVRAPGSTGSPWLTGPAAPHLYDPPLGRIWSANARPVDDPDALAAIGGDDAEVGAQYDLGARAQQIRDALLKLTSSATPLDMLRIQLDDRAVFLARWRDLMLRLLDDATIAGRPRRAEMRQILSAWDARADVDSVGYPLVRAFHDRTERAVWRMILSALGIAPAASHEAAGDDATSDDAAGGGPEGGKLGPSPLFEQPLWALVTQQPPNWLAAEYPSWRALLLAQLDATAADLVARCGALARCRWGAVHPVRIRHPLSRALPILSPLIDIPALELPGDHDVPRVQDGAFGASERLAVAPGHEDRGYVQLPGGESDHPLSPYYHAGFRAWADGRPLPLLPGPPQHRLVLQPVR